MTATSFDITIEQGATFSEEFDYRLDDETTPIDLTGYTGTAEMHAWANGPLLMTFDLTIDGTNGKVTLYAPASRTASLDKSGVFDVKLVNGTDISYLIRGSATTIRSVTP